MLHRAPDDYFRRKTFGPLHENAELLANHLFWGAVQKIWSFTGPEHDRIGKIGSKLRGCCRFPTLEQSESAGRVRLCPGRCKHRMCSHCRTIDTKARQQKIRVIATLMDDPRFITLTVRSRPGVRLKKQIHHVNENFAKLRKHPDWRKHVTGGLAVMEITRSNGAWHVHIHALVDGVYWPQKRALAAWESIVGDSAGVDIRKVYGANAVARYVAKYLGKGPAVGEWPVESLAEFAHDTHGLRTLRTWGKCYRIDSPDPEQVASESEESKIDDWLRLNIDVNDVQFLADRDLPEAKAMLEAARSRRAEVQAAALRQWLRACWQHMKPPAPWKPPPTEQLWLIAIGAGE